MKLDFNFQQCEDFIKTIEKFKMTKMRKTPMISELPLNSIQTKQKDKTKQQLQQYQLLIYGYDYNDYDNY